MAKKIMQKINKIQDHTFQNGGGAGAVGGLVPGVTPPGSALASLFLSKLSLIVEK